MILRNKLKYRKEGRAYCVEATQWDFHQFAGKFGYHPDANIHPDDKTDIFLSKENIDYNYLLDTALFSIGGYISQAKATAEGICLTDGLALQNKLQTKHIGIISFEELDPDLRLETYPITKEDITIIDHQDGLYPRVYFHPKGLDIRDSVVGLVVAGELYLLPMVKNKLVQITSPNTLRFDLSKWKLFCKVWKIKDIFNDSYNRLGLTPFNDGRIKTKEVLSERFLKALFSLPQNFIVVFRTKKTMQFEKKMVAQDRIPLRYYLPADQHEDIGFAHEPLVFSDGRWMPYISYDDKNGVVICCEDTMVYPQQNDTLWRRDQPYLNEMNISSRKGKPRQAHFYKITTQEKE